MVWAWLLLSGCGPGVDASRSRGGAAANDGPSFVEPPRVEHGAAPLMSLGRVLTVHTDRPTRLEVVCRGGGETLVQRFGTERLTHVVPVVGLLPETTFDIEVRAIDATGASVLAVDRFGTDALPTPFPRLEVLTLDAARMEPGLTVLPLQVPGGEHRYAVALDDQARVRWVLGVTNHLTDLRLTDAGEVWLIQRSGVERRGILGIVQTRWEQTGDGENNLAVDVGGFHHDAFPVEGGFVSLGRATRDVEGYPPLDDPIGPGSAAELYIPRLVQVADDGAVLVDIDLGDALDLGRISASSHEPTVWGLDWAHANAAAPDGDGWLVSLRHQDAVVRIDAAGEVDWILANPDGWLEPLASRRLKAPPGMPWPFHMHAPVRLPDGGLLLFDNGNGQATPYAPEPAGAELSRVVAYDLDPAAGTVRERWAVGDTGTGWLFSDAVGDADWLPGTGNVLAVYGRLEGEGVVGNAEAGRGEVHARVIEFDPEQPVPAAMDLRVWSPADEVAEGWTVYRAQRIDRLHPSVVLRDEPGWEEAVGGRR
ncbi:MAG: arylsulfate sulfotransferase [Myxococcota bacterium]